MQTVAELNNFRKHANAAGMSDEDIQKLVYHLAERPDDGVEIEGTGGCRKLRFAIRSNNKGKSGGVRTITFYSGAGMPVFLITAFGKGQKVNLTKSERNELKKLTTAIKEAYSERVYKLAVGE